MIKCCIIGLSGYGNVHYNDLIREQETGNAEITAATIRRPEKEPEKVEKLKSLGTKIFTDYKDMLNEFKGQLDLCCIPTGIHLHTPMTIDALEAGMNVYVEKPIAATIQEVKQMKEAEKRTGKFVAVGYQSMYALEAAKMKKFILDGNLGKIKSIKVKGLWPRDSVYYSRNNWAGHLEINGRWVLDSPYNNAIAHQLNMICWLAGRDFEASAKLKNIQAELYRGNAIQSADTATMRILTEDNIPLYFLVTHCSDTQQNPNILVTGEKGTLTWIFNTKCIIELDDGTKEEWEADARPVFGERIFSALIGKIEGRDSFTCTLDIAGTQTLCVNGAHQSSPVRFVGEENIYYLDTDNGGKRTVIKGIDSLLTTCFAKECLLSDLNVSWAVPAPVFSLEGYDSFEACAE